MSLSNIPIKWASDVNVCACLHPKFSTDSVMMDQLNCAALLSITSTAVPMRDLRAQTVFDLSQPWRPVASLTKAVFV